MDDTPSILLGLIFLAVGLAIYFVPAILGQKKKNNVAIFALNLLLGWTVVGWVAALVWALTKEQAPAVVVASQQLAPPILCRTCGKYSPCSSAFCASCGASFVIQTSNIAASRV